MRKTKLRRIWLQIRRSAWYPAIAALLPNFIISLAWSYGASGGITGFVASFAAVEGLVILILVVARPALQAEQLFERAGFIEVDTPEAKVLVGKIRAELPPAEFAESWTQAFPKLRDVWVGLLQESEKALRADAVTSENLRAMIDTFASASAQIRSGRPFDIYTLKKAACYLGRPEAQKVTRVLVINRIQPVLWFVPEMVIYFLDLFRHVKDHPVKVEFIRISIFEDEEWRRANDPRWRISYDVDPLKAFIAINQMAGISLKGLTLGKFSEAVERFIAANEARIQAIGETEIDELKEFIRDVAFIMYCEDEKPIKVFRGRQYPPRAPQNRHTEPVIMWPEIENTAEQELYYELFTALDGVASPLPPVNLAQVAW
jgi:uncharacterized membrane protein (Fun14 family)